MTYTTLLLVLCVGAVLPTLAIKYTYEVKYLDVPVSKVQTGVNIVAFVGNTASVWQYVYVICVSHHYQEEFKDEAQTALFKEPVHTAQ